MYFIRIVVEVAIAGKCSKSGVIGVRVGAVASTIDVAVNCCIDTYRITAKDMTRNIVTTIYVSDSSATDDGTGRQAGWEFIA